MSSSSIKSPSKDLGPQNSKSPRKPSFIDGNQINHIYKLHHINLDLALKELKAKIDSEFEEFRLYLLAGLNNVNYIRYLETYPEDSISFIFKENIHASTSEEKLDKKTQTLQRMAEFELIKNDRAGVADNCLYEIKDALEHRSASILNFKELCPSGNTFIRRHKGIIDNFMPFWKNFGNELNLASIFRDISPTFPKEEVKKIGSILAQTNKSVKSASLLFRASEHNFLSSAFKEICVGRPNTFLIAKSEHGKIFGAFTPCKWLNTKQKEFVSDPSAMSFLYSLDESMVFPIKKNQLQYAISAYGGWGPIYGSPYGPDLSISDKCHQNDNSVSSLGSHYEIPVKIKEYSQEAFSLLAGSKKFKVVEYQVYQLQIE